MSTARENAAPYARIALVAVLLGGCAARSAPPQAAPSRTAPSGATGATGATGARSPDYEGAKSEDAYENRAWRERGWVTFTVGASAAVVALGTSFMMLHGSSVRASNCNPQKVCSREGLDANGEIESLAGVNAGAWALAIVGIGVGAYLVLTHPSDSRGEQGKTAIGVAPNGSGFGLNVRSTF